MFNCRLWGVCWCKNIIFMNGTIKLVEGEYQGLEAFDNVHVKNFFKAVLEVDNNYYYYSNNYQNGTSQMEEQLERVFAYELYHQWSIILENYNNGLLNEDDKRIINGEAGKKLDGCPVFPDMILHKGQGDCHNQEIAIEIKRKVSLSEENLVNDLEKLSYMHTEGKLKYGATPFKYCVFLLTGGTENDLIKKKKNKRLTDICDDIICVFCQHKGELQYISMDEIKMV